MNERIKELAEQAGEWYMNNSKEFPSPQEWNEKFAELLIDECITQCSKALVEHTGQPSVTHNYAVGLCQDNIKEHFGVEGMSTEDKKTLIKELLGVKND